MLTAQDSRLMILEKVLGPADDVGIGGKAAVKVNSGSG